MCLSWRMLNISGMYGGLVNLVGSLDVWMEYICNMLVNMFTGWRRCVTVMYHSSNRAHWLNIPPGPFCTFTEISFLYFYSTCMHTIKIKGKFITLAPVIYIYETIRRMLSGILNGKYLISKSVMTKQINLQINFPLVDFTSFRIVHIYQSMFWDKWRGVAIT